MAIVFRGEYRHTLDSKGRLIMPLEYREKLGGMFFICKGTDEPCLNVYPEDEWYAIEEKIARIPDLTSVEGKMLHRYLIAGSSSCQPDNQGRVMIKDQLREFAGLTKEVVLAGVGSHIEIWEPEAYDRMMGSIHFGDIGRMMKEQNWEQL